MFERFVLRLFFTQPARHVPLMEDNQKLSTTTSCTYYTVMAEKYGALRFVLISTDKAVNDQHDGRFHVVR